MKYNGRILDIKYEETCFAYGLDIVSESDRVIRARGNYNDDYRLDKIEKKLYCNEELLGTVNKFIII